MTADQLRACELSIGEIAFNAWQEAEGKTPRDRWDAAANASINAHCSDPARIVDELASRFPLVVVAKHINAALPGLINFVASLSVVGTRADSGEAVSDLRGKIAAMKTREEWLGGQRTKYVQLDEVLGYIDTHPRATSAEVERDAARYRWLRTSVANPAYPAFSGQFGVGMITGERLDKAIDAALAKRGEVG